MIMMICTVDKSDKQAVDRAIRMREESHNCLLRLQFDLEHLTEQYRTALDTIALRREPIPECDQTKTFRTECAA